MEHDPATTGLVLLARLTLGVIFLHSAWGKLADMRGFRRGVAEYHLLPAGAVAPLALVVPLLELLLATALLLGVLLPLAGAGAAGLLVTFSAAIAINLRRGRAIACNCHGGAQQTPISWGLVVRNLVLLGLALLLVMTAPYIGLVWQGELAVLTSWALVPLLLVGTGGGLLAALLTTTVDVWQTVRGATTTERSAI